MQDQIDIVDHPSAPMPTHGRSFSAAAVAAIFERVLAFSPIDEEGDFFALGGDSIIATALALEIEAEFGIKLRVSILFDAPTPAMLARAATNLAARSDGPPVLLKAGSGAPQIFLAPGSSGTPAGLRSMVSHVDVCAPVYKFLRAGLRHGTAAGVNRAVCRSVPAGDPRGAASWTVRPRRILDGRGGRPRAGREADRRRRRGALLALLDTSISPRRSPWVSKLAIWRRRAVHHAAYLRSAGWRAIPSFVLARCLGVGRDLGIMLAPPWGRPRPDDPRLTPAVRRMIESSLAAAVTYRPRFYPGTLTYFEAGISDALPACPQLTWRRLARKLVVHVVDADHWQMMRRQSADTARQFSECLRWAKAGHANFEAAAPGNARSNREQEGFNQ
ncbi:MAG: phosphopantetheine-binding protein [Acetobacteraceae bacterium]